MLGREIAKLANGFYLPGNYELLWDASNEASGIYFVRMNANNQISSQKIILVK